MSSSDDNRNLREAVQMLARDNMRLCDRMIAAEKVIETAEGLRVMATTMPNALRALIAALDAYTASKPS